MGSHRMFKFASFLIKFTTSIARVFRDKRDINSPSLRNWRGLLPRGVAALSEQLVGTRASDYSIIVACLSTVAMIASWIIDPIRISMVIHAWWTVSVAMMVMWYCVTMCINGHAVNSSVICYTSSTFAKYYFVTYKCQSYGTLFLRLFYCDL